MAGLMIAIANSVSSNYVVGAAGPSYDPDAQAFFTAEASAGVTLTDSQKTAVNDLVVNLKAANIWSKMKALYPIVGGTATAHKFNLKNPLDTDAAFRLTFTGGWTHSATGMLPNGTNAYANTFLNTTTNLALNSGSFGFYSRTNSLVQSCDMGAYSTLPDSFTYIYTYITGALRDYRYCEGSAGITRVSGVTSTQGFMYVSRTGASIDKGFRNGNVEASVSASSSSTSVVNLILGAYSNAGTPTAYSVRELAFAYISDGLTDLECQVFNQIVEGYQFALGRNINPTQSFYYNSSYSNETNAYLYSTQITDTTIQVATNTLVSDLKTAGIWSKMKAIYPMAGGTATTNKFNLVNSQDTNAAFRLSFVGGWTHSSLGALPNGTNTYADTFLTPSTSLLANDKHLSFYSRTNLATASNSSTIGSDNSSDGFCRFTIRQVGNARNAIYGGTNGTMVASNETDSRGFYLSTRPNSTSSVYYKNASSIAIGASANGTSSQTPLSLLISAARSAAAITYYDNKECAFASIGDSLTATEAASFYTAVQNFQISLGRAIYVSPPTVSDADAQAFINAATIVDQVESTAVNNLVIGLKADSLWTKMKAVYPMVGSAASSQKYNLVNPLDTNAAFRLTFAGGWTHSFNGALPNGTNTYADTFLTPSSHLSLNSAHLSFYSRTNSTGNYADIGSGNNSTNLGYIQLLSKWSDSKFYGLVNDNDFTDNTVSDSLGFFIGSRTASNVIKTFKSGTTITSKTAISTFLSPYKIPIGARYLQNVSGAPNYTSYSNRQCAFASIGDGLTDTEAANLYNRVQTFNTALQRQV